MSDDRKSTVLSKNTLVPLGVVVTAVCATWYLATVMNGIDRKLDRALQDRWTVTEMERWAYQLERSNRDAAKPLEVPDVRGIHSANP